MPNHLPETILEENPTHLQSQGEVHNSWVSSVAAVVLSTPSILQCQHSLAIKAGVRFVYVSYICAVCGLLNSELDVWLVAGGRHPAVGG
jgi:hypothetical protein